MERQSSSATGAQSDGGFFFRRISTVKPHQIACVEIGEIAKPPWDFSSRGRRQDLPSIPPRKISRWAAKKKRKNSETGLGAVEGFSQTALTPRRTAHAHARANGKSSRTAHASQTRSNPVATTDTGRTHATRETPAATKKEKCRLSRSGRYNPSGRSGGDRDVWWAGSAPWVR